MTELLFSLLILSVGIVGCFRLARFLRKLPAYLTAKSGPPVLKPLPQASLLSLVLVLVLALFVVGLSFVYSHLVRAANPPLSVEILAGYNLVVDSNVTSPSTFGPSAATVSGRVCNTGSTPLTNVTVYIGNAANQTPGLYPRRYVTDTNFSTLHPALVDGGGSYAFTHEGGSLGLSDATRQAGVLQPGQCTVQYWTFSYPRCENVGGTADDPQCQNNAVWGDSVKPEDDLWLTFDIWAKGFDGTSTITTTNSWKMSMRNEISAMANKIQPNGNPGGLWFNTDPSTIRPGGIITTNGILYRIGNVNFGFDNNGDYLPDNNFWVQPIGNPGSFDPGCFRLIQTSGIITVAGGTPKVFTFTDQLYFTRPQIPEDNTNIIGEVYYTYVAIGSNCAVTPSPYQEAASGYDNEKFNADYGAGGPPPVSIPQALVTIDKSSNPDLVNVGAVITYSIPFVNQSATEPAGLTFYSGAYVNNPLVISDTIPNGTQYITGTASYTLGFSPNSGVKILYSTDNGQSWSEIEPTPAISVTNIQWWLQEPLPPNKDGSATFAVRVPGAYSGGPAIENCANAQFGTGPSIGRACDTTLVQGNNSVGDFVWRDEDGDGIQDAGEAPLSNIAVSLYWDKNSDGILDSKDVQMLTTTTGLTATGNYTFTNLYDGRYLVTVDTLDPDLPNGYNLTTRSVYTVDLDSAKAITSSVTYTQADFGFGPTLRVQKGLSSLDPAYVGENVIYTIDLVNTRPGDGTANGFCRYTLWANTVPAVAPPTTGSGNSAFADIGNAAGPPNSQYATTDLSNNPDDLSLGGFNTSGKTGNVTKVELIAYVKEFRNLKTDDDIQLQVYRNGSLISNTISHLGSGFSNPVGSIYLLRDDVTAYKGSAWVWSDFAGDVTEAKIVANKGTGAGASGDIGLDAMAYVVTTDQICANPNDHILTLPLSDTYDADHLQFVSAEPPQSTVTTSGASPNTVGSLTWSNLGPLYAGGTRRITVTFKALTITLVTTNAVTSTNGAFFNGRLLNTASDTATVGINASGSISGVIWADTNGPNWTNPTGYGAGDTFLPNVTVELWGCFSTSTGLLISSGSGTQDCAANNGQWKLINTQATDTNGAYLFSGLRDGHYNIKVRESTLPAGFTTRSAETNALASGGAACGTCDGQWNTDAANFNTFNNIVNGATGENISNVSFGYRSATNQGGVTGYIWNDRDNDGIWDANEEPIPNVQVTLCDSAGVNCTITATTSSSGFYSFTVNVPVTYTIKVITTDLPGMTQSGDPDQPNTLCTTCDNTKAAFPVAAHEIKGPYNFGYTGGLSIGDTVYADWNGDGTQDSGEEGIGNVTVYLYRDVDGDGVLNSITDTLIATQTTTADGLYTFTNLAGNGNRYIVSVNSTTLPSGYTQTADPDQLGVTCTLCDGRGAVTLNSTNVTTVDFGYQPTGSASIGDFVWRDSDADGVQDGGESGISNVTIRLYEDTDNDGIISLTLDALVMTTTTNASGLYTFTNLPAGNFLVDIDSVITDTSGNRLTLGLSSDPHDVTLAANQHYLNADFGYIPAGIIGDLIWQDNNGNGQWEAGEPGIPGITVTLYISGSATPLYTMTTNASGIYSFTGLVSGTYTVRVLASSLPAGYIQTGDPEYPVLSGTTYLEICSDDLSDTFGGCNAESLLFLRPGQIDLTRDFGFRPPRSIGDFVWLDNDGDGVQDPGEPGLSGITITLTTPGGSVFTTTTDINGYYGFGGTTLNLDGTYTVSVITTSLPPAMTQTFDRDGTLDHYTTINITTTSVITDVDFGYRYAGSYTITGTVFYDQGGTGDTLTDTFTTGDTPYAGIPVYLYRQGSSLPVGSTTTDASGHYTFTNLSAYTYTVSANSSVSTLANLSLTASPSGTITSTYSVRTSVIVTNADVGNIDYGFFASQPLFTKSVSPIGTVAAGDTLTYTIVLSNGQATPITGVTISDTVPANTNYVTNSLAITPASAANLAGAGDNLPLIRISPITVAANSLVTITFRVTVDASLPLTVTAITNTALLTTTYAQTTSTVANSTKNDYIIGDSVWFDLNHDGLQNEVNGLAGITLTLTYPSGTVVTTTTSATGAYSFTVPSDQAYTLTVVPANFVPGGPLAGYIATPNNQGGDDTRDSDGQPDGSGGVIFVTPVITQSDDTFDFGFYLPVEPALTKAVSFTPGLTATLGTTVTYVIAVPDPAISRTLTSVVVTDTLNSVLYPVTATVFGGLTPTVALNGQDVTATFGAIIAGSQARMTVTAIISNAAIITSGANIANTAMMTHAQALALATSNPVTTTIGEPSLTVDKSVTSSTGSLTNVDGTTLLTYTIRLTNSGTSPAYSVRLTDAVPSGISVTNYLGSFPWSGPVVGPNTMTWTVNTIDNLSPNNVVVLTYTARLSGAIAGSSVTNLVTTTYHSLTDTVPGARQYGPLTDTTTITPARPNVVKTVTPSSSNVSPLRIGDIITYTLVTTVPPGTFIPWPYQYDYLPVGFRYVTNTFAITTNLPFSGVSLTDTLSLPLVSEGITGDIGVLGLTSTANPNVGARFDTPGQQALEWWLQPLHNGGRSTTGLITVTFQIQLIGLDLTGAATWTDQLVVDNGTNRSFLRWNLQDAGRYTTTVPVDSDASSQPTTYIAQPNLTLDKHSLPVPDSTVNPGDTITYTLTITNNGRAPAYDLVLTDTLPAGLTYQNTISNPAAGVAITATPSGQLITYAVNQLAAGPGASMVITLVVQVDPSITGSIILTNTASLPYYDSQPGGGPGVISPTQRTYTDGSDTVSHPVAIVPGLTLDPDHTSTVPPGQVVTYTHVLTNEGNATDTFTLTVTSVGPFPVTDDIPPSITLTAGQTATFVITVTVPAGANATDQGVTVITATSTISPALQATDTDTTNTAVVPGLSLDPDHTATVQPGQTITYTHVLTNEGNATDTFTLTVTSVGPFPVTDDIPPTITLTAGQTATFVITVTVPAGASATDQGVTVITATSSLSPSLSATDTDTTNTAVVPGLTLDPDHTQTVQPGQTITYTHVLTNEGNATDTFTLTVTSTGPFPVTDDIPPSITLTAGQTATFVITVTVPAGASTTDQGVTVITATSTISPALQVTDTDTTNVELADVTIVKTDDPDPVAAGGVLTYTLIYTNNGAAVAQNVVITDNLPAGATFGGVVSTNPALPAPVGTGQTWVWTVGTLAAGDSGSIVFTVTVDGNTSGVITNNVMITTSTPDSNPNNNDDDEPTYVGRPGLSITKTRVSSSPVLIGQPVQFQIVVENTGNTDLATVTLIDTYDTAYLNYNGATPVSDDNNNDGVLTWANLGPIAAGGRVTVTVNFTATASTQALLNGVTINAARALATDTNGTSVLPVNDTDTVGVINPGLAVDKSINIARVAPHQVVTYTITITNVGDVTINPVRVTDTLDTGLIFIPGTANPAPSAINGQQLVWNDVTNGAGLAPHARTQITLLVSVPTITGTYGNLVVTTGDHPAGTTPPVTDRVSTHVEDPSIQVDKELNAPGVVGDLITFTIRITNTGPSILDQVPLFDSFTGPVQYVGGTPRADTVDNTNRRLTWNDLTTFFGDLAPGQSAALVTVFRLTTMDSEFSMTNTARVTHADDVFNNVANEDEDTEVLTNVPTAVDLLYFTSQQTGNSVELHWATAVEYDNYGFRLLRSISGNFADAVEIGFVPGQGQGTVSGTIYKFTDATVEVNQTYTYWLVDVDFNGVETPHSEITSISVTAGGNGSEIYLPLIFK
ncbi:MAG: DUF11 domain-containing protein [Anaerolineales bacterium]|nr:DUF11 domain-containing protein [Anaerolineales bacterium]